MFGLPCTCIHAFLWIGITIDIVIGLWYRAASTEINIDICIFLPFRVESKNAFIETSLIVGPLPSCVSNFSTSTLHWWMRFSCPISPSHGMACHDYCYCHPYSCPHPYRSSAIVVLFPYPYRFYPYHYPCRWQHLRLCSVCIEISIGIIVTIRVTVQISPACEEETKPMYCPCGCYVPYCRFLSSHQPYLITLINKPLSKSL